jgi:hypothetical protein
MSKTLLILTLGSLFTIASPINSGPRGSNLYARGQASTQSTGPRQSSSSRGVIGRDRGDVWNMSPLLRSRPVQSSWSPNFGSLPAPRDRKSISDLMQPRALTFITGPLAAQKLSSLRGAGQTLPVKQYLNSGRNSSPAQIAAARASPFPSNVEAAKLAKANIEALLDADSKTQSKVQSTLPAKVSPTVVTKVSPTGVEPETSASSSSKGPSKTSSTFEPTIVPANMPSAMPGAKLGSNNKPAALDEADHKHMNSIPGPSPAAGQNDPNVTDEDVPIGGGTIGRGKKDPKMGINIMDSPPDLDKVDMSNLERPSQPSHPQATDEDVPIGGGTKVRGEKDLQIGYNIMDPPPGFENMDISEIKSLLRAKPALSGKSSGSNLVSRS